MSAPIDLSRAEWKTSSHSSVDGGNCVEWAPALATAHGIVPVRDSKIPGGPALTFGPAAWSSFITAASYGYFQP
ncbi:DUF397 domain-containing protein [Streptomyces sp. URMC 124]|uniref:DUF397 domain-containing protein n=1 Tax=Streptomyces sp. URMC 124 TaxID=3423405 RepID=UPI003F1B4555